MGVKRKQHGAQFKAQVAMAALSGEKTLADLSAEYGVHPTMISTWKQELVKRAGELFERGGKTAADPQKAIDRLHQKIGQLQVERDFLVGQPAIARLLKGGRPQRSSKRTHFRSRKLTHHLSHFFARANSVFRLGEGSRAGCAFCSPAQQTLDAAERRVRWVMVVRAAISRAQP